MDVKRGLVARKAAAYKTAHDASLLDHHTNYIPGALIQMRRRAKVLEPIAPTAFPIRKIPRKDACNVRRHA